ncbi:MAG: carbohydrate ABC transporter permease [Spirochaetales bacterium]
MSGKPFTRRSLSALPGYLLLGFWSLLVLIPLWVMVVNSFKVSLDIFRDPFGLPVTVSTAGYEALLAGGSFLTYFFNSLLITTVSIAGILVIASAAAYGLANWTSRASRYLLLVFLAGLMIPIRIASINLLGLVKDLGLMDSLWGLFPIYVAMGLPMGVFVLTEFIKAVPKEILNAARIDGAGSVKIFVQIVLPLTRPALATVAIFNLVNLWNDLWFPLIIIRSDDQRTLMLGVTRLFGQYQTDWNKVLAVLTTASIPIILLYLVLSKQFIQGLTAGAVKE